MVGGVDLGRADQQRGGEDRVVNHGPIQGGEAADRPCCPSMAAQVPDVHGRRLRRGLPLPEPEGAVARGQPPRRHISRGRAVHGELPQEGCERRRRGGGGDDGVESSGGGGAGELGDQAAADGARAELAEAVELSG